MNAIQENTSLAANQREIQGFEVPVDARTAARFLGVSPSLVYAYVERKQIPHFRMMGHMLAKLGGGTQWTFEQKVVPIREMYERHVLQSDGKG